MLHGMEGGLAGAVRSLGPQVDVYAPIGDLVPGMSYLVRRLRELVQRELRAPGPRATSTSRRSWPHPCRRSRGWWRRRDAKGRATALRAGTGAALARRRRALRSIAVEKQAVAAHDLEVPAVLAGRRIATEDRLVSVDPGRIEHVVATSSAVDTALADQAVRPPPRRAPHGPAARAERAGVLVGAAAWMRSRRDELAALMVFEAGKPWPEADADVCEAIDFCEFYAREALRLDGGGTVQSPPGERNELRYRARGVAAVIAPWNFPLAIPTGMVTAALAAGNRSASSRLRRRPSPSAWWRRWRRPASRPACSPSCPGAGEVVGAHLVAHPGVAVIAFTGSRPVGLSILAAAPQVGPGSASSGGSSPSSAGRTRSSSTPTPIPTRLSPRSRQAPSRSRQKCSAASRLIVHRDIYEPIVERLVAHTALLELGHPEEPAVTVGPVIDADAHSRLLQVQRTAAARGRVRGWRTDVPDGGWYVGPMIVDGIARRSPGRRRALRSRVAGVVR